MSDDPNVSQRYRELGREEPPRALDDAILAASRRAAQTRPAPLVVPTGRQRWYFPLAAAAIIVLAVAVTIHVEREQPDTELVVQAETAPAAPVQENAAQPESPAAPASKPVPERKAPPKLFAPDPKPAPEQPVDAVAESRELRAQRGEAQMRQVPAPVAEPPPRDGTARESARADAAGARAPSPQAMRRGPAAPSDAPQLSSLAKASPEQWLQGIADLKRQGWHDEAEKQLADFRKRYPNYRIPEAITEKFEKR